MTPIDFTLPALLPEQDAPQPLAYDGSRRAGKTTLQFWYRGYW